MSKHWTLNVWGPHRGEFVLIRADADWFQTEDFGGWFSVTVGLLGFCACVAYYPRGFAAGVPVESLGREHGA